MERLDRIRTAIDREERRRDQNFGVTTTAHERAPKKRSEPRARQYHDAYHKPYSQGVPYVPVKMSQELFDKLDSMACKAKMSRSKMIRTLIERV